MPATKQPPRAVLAWESLPASRQFALAFPVLTAVIALAHLTMLNQPLGRGLMYGVFWGLVATAAVIVASRNEAARRRGEMPRPGDAAGR